MKRIILPLVFLFALAVVSCNTGGSTANQVDADTMTQVEDVIQDNAVDTSAVSDSAAIIADSTVVE
jgi:hypothetical protein